MAEDLSIVLVGDLHFAVTNSLFAPEHAIRRASEALKLHPPRNPALVVLCGDVTDRHRPSGYRQALRALANTPLVPDPLGIIVVPGNHDVVTPEVADDVEKVPPFAAFNRFAMELTHDSSQRWNDQSARIVPIGSYDLVLLNTSQHLDHRYGTVDLPGLKAALGVARRPVIVVAHHGPLSSGYAGEGMSNAYELLSILSRLGVAAYLHGHLHSDQLLEVGRSATVVAGVGSLAFTPDGNMNNQFAVVEFSDGHVESASLFRYFLNDDEFRPSAWSSE